MLALASARARGDHGVDRARDQPALAAILINAEAGRWPGLGRRGSRRAPPRRKTSEGRPEGERGHPARGVARARALSRCRRWISTASRTTSATWSDPTRRAGRDAATRARAGTGGRARRSRPRSAGSAEPDPQRDGRDGDTEGSKRFLTVATSRKPDGAVEIAVRDVGPGSSRRCCRDSSIPSSRPRSRVWAWGYPCAGRSPRLTAGGSSRRTTRAPARRSDSAFRTTPARPDRSASARAVGPLVTRPARPGTRHRDPTFQRI
jgi:hypothetical protein